MITHIVLFKLKSPDPETLAKTRDVLLGMKGRIPQLRHLEVGVDVLRSERSYDIGLYTKFDSLEDLQAYQVHPVHQEVIQYMASVRESSVAVDYES
ncbi:Dabb family protein [Paenibacillus thermoaerophilus]|uniref:Dabb family protein n=1 Tax=Paenibacillus thermoaerophilus TaxID=1215385 RepID=A0ABW2V3Q0_9BACL|nr:Dabb family protein [Paenibacillus thermoaerophilus]TMV17153.1 Dabb family protein [Paenibacillus thermoaerophilus]